MPEAVVIRSTTENDRDAVLILVRSAFSDSPKGGEEEVEVVADTWALGGSVQPVDLVAVDDGMVVGHVLAAEGTLGAGVALAVAPLAVAPTRQGQGIGTNLMHALLTRAERAGWPLVLLLGSPDYYRRFGFEPSGPLGIVYPPVGPDSPYFQVRRFGSLDESCHGEFTYCWEQRG
jgi:putative acetyltransferase